MRERGRSFHHDHPCFSQPKIFQQNLEKERHKREFTRRKSAATDGGGEALVYFMFCTACLFKRLGTIGMASWKLLTVSQLFIFC